MATQITLNLRIPQARVELNAALAESLQEVMATKIHPAAVEKSPVTEEGALINAAMGKHPPHILGTGTNRRTIDFTVEQTENGPQAKLFTQSGYGGYLEVGTSKMRAQPYLYPAFIENVDAIPVTAKVKIEALGTKKR